jgi:hypothetical protein
MISSGEDGRLSLAAEASTDTQDVTVRLFLSL